MIQRSNQRSGTPCFASFCVLAWPGLAWPGLAWPGLTSDLSLSDHDLCLLAGCANDFRKVMKTSSLWKSASAVAAAASEKGGLDAVRMQVLKPVPPSGACVHSLARLPSTARYRLRRRP
jgi:hypothetical protein